MLNNKNYSQTGNLNKDLILATQGKVKVRFGKRFVDLIDENGKLAVPSDVVKSNTNSKTNVWIDDDDDLNVNIGDKNYNVVTDLSNYYTKQETTENFLDEEADVMTNQEILNIFNT